MFSWLPFFSQGDLASEQLSAEDAQLVKNLLQLRSEFQQTQSPLMISADGLKTLGEIYYTNKFKNL